MLSELLSDKTIKAKEKVESLALALLERRVGMDELVTAANGAKDAVKATCIEALESATKQQPGIADEASLEFVIRSLTDKAPRVKWESAKVIANVAHRFPHLPETAVVNLLINAEHEGTVVRWSAATALGEIVQLPGYTEMLKPALETIASREEKNSIRKVLLDALKKCANTEG
jgi:HEAT repeat protein